LPKNSRSRGTRETLDTYIETSAETEALGVVARHRHLQHFGRTTRKPKCHRHAASRCARIWPGHRSPSQRSACRRAHCQMPRNRRCQRRGAGARVKDALADGAMSGCCIGLVRRCALAGIHGLRFEGSRLNHCDHLRARCLARSQTRRWFRPGSGCYTARQSGFYACEPAGRRAFLNWSRSSAG
jgi:hypothetical protein